MDASLGSQIRIVTAAESCAHLAGQFSIRWARPSCVLDVLRGNGPGAGRRREPGRNLGGVLRRGAGPGGGRRGCRLDQAARREADRLERRAVGCHGAGRGTASPAGRCRLGARRRPESQPADRRCPARPDGGWPRRPVRAGRRGLALRIRPRVGAQPRGGRPHRLRPGPAGHARGAGQRAGGIRPAGWATVERVLLAGRVEDRADPARCRRVAGQRREGSA